MSSVASLSRDVEVKSVLIATDFSAVSDKPLRHALAIARHYGAKFYLAHVVSSIGFTIAGPDASNEACQAASRDAHQLEDELVESGALAGLQHEVIVRQGEVWEELDKVIREEKVDLVIIGTHGRAGMRKLILGSVAEQIFRHADCMVLTVGPGASPEVPIDSHRSIRPFLFATDFGAASLHALPFVISSANHFAAKLVLLHAIPAVTVQEPSRWYTANDVMHARENARIANLQRLEELLSQDTELEIKPEFRVEFGAAGEMILHTAASLNADAIIMGLHRSVHISTASHMPWATAYEVVRRAGCAVLTVRS
jgi:nucleotide-binding universal stress UspA family protein